MWHCQTSYTEKWNIKILNEIVLLLNGSVAKSGALGSEMLALPNMFHSKMTDNKENCIVIIILDSHLPKLI
jgi:hypothetical protein